MKLISAVDSVDSVFAGFKNDSSRYGDDSEIAIKYLAEFDHLPTKARQDLLLLLSRNESGEVRFTLTDQCPRDIESSCFADLVEQLGLPVFTENSVLRLEPVCIAKPWGQEIWYTGIEQRGESRVGDGVHSIPISWLLKVLPSTTLGNGIEKLNLLKILDPLPEKIFGDLYFELHQQKQEVYVVTNVDANAWPDGQGRIKLGFNRDKRAEYESDEAFKNAYLEAVRQYRKVRLQVDALLDRMRSEENLSPTEPVPAGVLKQWMQSIPEDIAGLERDLRHQMDEFAGHYSLAAGDVVKVPLLVPHALQHGVRTVEFQTPVYERKILSFAQKVLTQDHWDTEEAVELMQLDSGLEDTAVLVTESEGCRVERIVEFDEFRVSRLQLGPKASYQLNQQSHYRLVMSLSDKLLVDNETLAHEEAIWVLAASHGPLLSNSSSDKPAYVLVAEPVY